MSDERLEQLGLPRRSFLKKAALVAFVAPVIVSFGLDGLTEVASASPNCGYPNGGYPNGHHHRP